MSVTESRTALKELPLDDFVPTNSDGIPVTPSKRTRHNKRSRSPAVPSSCSPVKRRIISEESLTSPTLRESFSSSKSRRFSPSRFQALLRGPGSPVKKIDFTAAAKGDENLDSVFPTGVKVSVLSRPRSRTSTPARSNSLSARSTSRASLQSPTLMVNRTPIVQEMDDLFSSPIIVSSPHSLLTVPRTISPPDPASTHYPGFDVYLDPHDYLPKARSILSIGDTLEGRVDRMRYKELEKENIPPRKRSQKLALLAFGGPLELSGLKPEWSPFEDASNNRDMSKPTTPRAKRQRETSVKSPSSVHAHSRVMDGRASAVVNLPLASSITIRAREFQDIGDHENNRRELF
ncbi:hypothetical protein K474DRAFT_511467 [Panus rudis PR-1116 ss-1]|nr:hypothetical protein K474DRAFT_511467 [Panus rudis PR-1116 ss-1]